MNKLFLLFLITPLLLSVAVKAQAELDPEGLWLTENGRSAIYVKKCGETKTQLCGYIDWIIEGGMQLDEKNPDMSERRASLCGMQILYGLTQSASNPNQWTGGNIYKADDGDTYNAKIEMQSADQMKLRGFIGVSLLGKTQTWKRVSAKDYPRCKTS